MNTYKIVIWIGYIKAWDDMNESKWPGSFDGVIYPVIGSSYVVRIY